MKCCSCFRWRFDREAADFESILEARHGALIQRWEKDGINRFQLLRRILKQHMLGGNLSVAKGPRGKSPLRASPPKCRLFSGQRVTWRWAVGTSLKEPVPSIGSLEMRLASMAEL